MGGDDTMIKAELAKRMEQLVADREPFVVATVVHATKPASVRPGDSALVLADGTIEGFVGGVCAQGSVRLYAARALESGEAVLLRLVPGLVAGSDEAQEGVVVSHNPCLSGGGMEIFLEPQLAAQRIVVVGDTPIARALEAVARAAGYDVGDELSPSDAAVVVASHGSGEEDVLARALEAGVGYVGLVASRRRGAAVVESLDTDDALRTLVRTPAGLDIGARTPADVAISILAEIVGRRTAHAPAPATAIDPVCGMEVAISDATPQLDGVYFCCEGCRSSYAAAQATPPT
ncbi:MAG TPA: XdhC family protein [Solirubrobacter sp.]|nr:XdhC family protein [Solirubrobacter sp.]